MTAAFDPLDVANDATLDALIFNLREAQTICGRKFAVNDLIRILIGMYSIPRDPNHPAGPVIVCAAHLLQRLINQPPIALPEEP